MKFILKSFSHSRWVLTSGIGLLLISLVFVPTQISNNYFDSLAFPHIVLLTLSSLVFLGILFLRNGFKLISRPLGAGLIFLILVYTISILRSENPIASMTGDTQRFTGAISLFAFLVIIIYHSNISIEVTKSFTVSVSLVITLITVLGALQEWNLISLPGSGGAGSTLGNIDFLSAWIGTTIPFFLFLVYRESLKKSILVLSELVLSIYLLIALDVKQGWVDLALSAFFGGIYLLRHRIRSLNLTKKTFYWAFGLAGFLWVELVLLVPFQKTKVPFIGTDPNVQIRTQYWLTGIKIFFRNIFFGVGPDNYGNYYQQYRTLTSVIREETITSNDAHSAFFQTISTLGIFGATGFLIVFALLVKSIAVNYRKYPNHRKFLYFVTSFFVIYSTNAMVSPITLPHKFIFWAYVGLMFGLAHKPEAQTSSDEFLVTSAVEVSTTTLTLQKINLIPILKVSLALAMAASLVVITLFSLAQTKLIFAINDLQHNSKSTRVLNYEHSSFLPCTYYYLTEQTIANQKSTDKVIKFAEAEVKLNPRCIDARLTLAKYYFATGDSVHIGPTIKSLMEMAPANRDVLGLVGQIATKLGDGNLLLAIHNQEVKLGFLK
jgi:O-Antigen ligase